MTDQEWEEKYKKTEKRMKKTFKIILEVIAVFFIMTGLLWGSFIYRTRYKITTVTTSAAPDGKYELILQAVGEAAWPFGPANGRLVLKENQRKVLNTDFTIYDDGKSIQDDSWTVIWHEDYAEVILSGEEQFDEQILLYFDGRTQANVLSDAADKIDVAGQGQADIQTQDGSSLEAAKSDVQTDFQTLKEDNWQEANPEELPQPYVKYVEVLEQIMTEHKDPNGREFRADENMDFENNAYAISDVDGDGRPELIFSFGTSYMGGMCEVVYGYDEESDTLREELAEWVNTTYYSNGLIKVSDSHNHGKDPEERGIWPYTLYRYEAETDSYELLYDVESWDGQIYSENFPSELDQDGDGLLYYVVEDGKTMEDADVQPFDREGYDDWVKETIPEWSKVNVVYHSLTEESIENIQKAYEQAAVYASQADRWMMYESGSFSCKYLLYDLDRDGKWELVTNLNQGTGRFSDNHFYALAGSGELMELPLVKLCDSKKRPWGSDFDLYSWTYMEAYQDQSGVIYYEGNDYTREGAYGGYDETGFYYLKDGIVYQDSIRTSSWFTHSDTEEEEAHYYRIIVTDEVEKEEVTEEQYADIREEYIEGMTKLQVYQNWVSYTEEELAEDKPSMAQVQMRLFESFLGSK